MIISLPISIPLNNCRAGLEKHFSRETFHILVNNTGGPAPGNAFDAKSDEYIKAFTNHLLCNQVLVQALVPGMRKSQYGRIINIISTSVKIPIRGLGVSNTIRGAVANWAKTLSLELGPYGITVNNILPGCNHDWSIRNSDQEPRKESIQDH